MLNLSELFGRSPFVPLQAHMTKVSDCVEKLNDIFLALTENDYPSVERIANEISELEHAADMTKNSIRENLTRGLFLVVDRANILDILRVQDNIADRAQDIGILLTLRQTELPEIFKDEILAFLQKNLEAFYGIRNVIFEIEDLVQSSFGGFEAEKVRNMIDQVAYNEHEADVMQQRLLKRLFQEADTMAYWRFHLWLSILKEVADISNLSEKLGHRVRMTLEIK